MNNPGIGQIDGTLAVNILQQIPTPIMAVNRGMAVIFLNRAGLKILGKSWKEIQGMPCREVFQSRHCGTDECRMTQVMDGGQTVTSRNEMKVNDRYIPIEYTAAAMKDDQGNIVGGLEYILDITERVRQENKLKEQSRTIMEISTPAIKLWDRVVILPVVGVVDSLRAQQMMNTMLTKIMETAAKVIILDIQGVAAVDTAVANHLIKIAKATKLMGCRCIISGISPAVAQTLVQLGIELGEISTNSTLKDALSDAFKLMDLEVRPKG
ncbi:STAS domain-containing protein [uncultured Desulfobacter sp.]|uniref:STAS domain-containing protein n=1 Tax=uncultured Desulfobacter sp. TaxID=240139 RepID=UPI002AABC523|nr:STAS domain-containing protein [uncultured Desulfobacter sp.]